MKRTLGYFVLTVCFGLGACKPGKPPVIMKTEDGQAVSERPPPPAPEEEDKAHKLLQQASELDQSGQSKEAGAARDKVVAGYPGTQAGASILRQRAEKALEAGNKNEALGYYEKLLFYHPEIEGAEKARSHYGELLLDAGRYSDAAKQLRSVFESTTDPQEKRRLAALLAEALQHSDGAKEALEIQVALRSAGALSNDERQNAEKAALGVVARQLTFSEAETLWKDVSDDEDWSFLLPSLGFKLAKVYYHVREYERSEELLNLVADRYGSTQFGQRARDFLKRLKDRFMVKTNRVGVMLPLSGHYGPYGERALAAVKLAFEDKPDVELVIKDTKGEPTAAAQAVEDLVLKHHVIAIIGPFFSKSSMAAALKAEELSVPILTLSHRDGLPQVGDWVFRTALTVQQQARALAKAAFEKMGWSRFAILYPRGPYGEAFAHAFWDEVDRRKGEIRAVESYERDQTTFREQVQKMVGRYYRYARVEYIQELRRLRAQKLPSHRFSAALEDFNKGLNPIVDFDAILIPDSGKNIGLIAPALAFEDIVLTHDPKTIQTIRKTTGNDELKPVFLIGGSTWNSLQTVDSCERYCEDAVFVDGYYPDNPDPKVRDFVSAFRKATGAEPYLSDAQAYDTAGLLAWLLANTSPPDRKTVRKLLTEQSTYKGVTGPLTFTNQGESKKDLFTFTIKEREIKIFKGPEEEPQG